MERIPDDHVRRVFADHRARRGGPLMAAEYTCKDDGDGCQRCHDRPTARAIDIFEFWPCNGSSPDDHDHHLVTIFLCVGCAQSFFLANDMMGIAIKLVRAPRRPRNWKEVN